MTALLAVTVLGWTATGASVFADEEPAESKSATKSDASKREDKDADKDETKKKDDVLVVQGGDIHTITGGTIRRGTIVIRDEKIEAIGRDVEIPEDAEIIDASGMQITPGFIAIDVSRLGVGRSSSGIEDTLNPFDRNMKLALGVGITTIHSAAGSSSGFGRRAPGDQEDREQVDAPDSDDMTAPASTAINSTAMGSPEAGDPAMGQGADTLQAIQPGAQPDIAIGAPDPTMNVGFIEDNRFVGLDPDQATILKMAQGNKLDFGNYQKLCPCCGLAILPTEPITDPTPRAARPRNTVVIKLSYGSLDGMLVKKNPFYTLSRGSLTGSLAIDTWRKELEKARDYLKKQAEHEAATKAGKKSTPPRKTVSDNLLDLVQRKIPLRIAAYTKGEILSMIRLAEELDYSLSLDQPIEAWLAADELAESGVSVTVTPRVQRDPNFGEEGESGSWIETSRVMEQSGITFAVKSLSSSISLGGLAGRDLTSLPLEAAFAVRGGASNAEALKALTIHPAKMLGIDDQVGSLEVGKDADLLILTGDPLDYRTYVDQAIVNGRLVYERKVDRVLPTE
ncbi:MAG: amidohydrolase family protein [Planctomycetota bacterium]